MSRINEDELDQVRQFFAQKINSLIGNKPNQKNLAEFSEATGIPERYLSQWRNPRHTNWPSAKNLIALAVALDMSIDKLIPWRVLTKEKGQGKRRLRSRAVKALVIILLGLGFALPAAAQYSPQQQYQMRIQQQELQRELERQQREIEDTRQRQQWQNQERFEREQREQKNRDWKKRMDNIQFE